MKKYSVLVVGMGKRGMHHATAFNQNPKFQVVGICDIDAKRLDDAAAKLGNPQKGTDAAALAKALKPDVFCFCTMPHLRMPFIKAAVEGGARLIAFEKPVSLTSAELFSMRDLIRQAKVKAVVSHQHRYGAHYRKVKEIIASGALGRVHTVYGTATGWMTHMLSHLIDYTCWFNDYAPGSWVMAQAAGGSKYSDNHPSPDYIGGFVQFANGVRGIYECGAGAPDQPEVAKWWGKNRIGAQGTEGFVEVLTNGGWRAVTRAGGYQSGEGAMNYDHDMPPYVQEMADWLDDDKRVHSCNFEHALIGAEVMLAFQRSAAEGGQVALPLTGPADEQTLLKSKAWTRPVIVSCEQNRKEFGLP
jgi:predicted dehydrogenase